MSNLNNIEFSDLRPRIRSATQAEMRSAFSSSRQDLTDLLPTQKEKILFNKTFKVSRIGPSNLFNYGNLLSVVCLLLIEVKNNTNNKIDN